MERTEQPPADLIDLGAVTTETRGGIEGRYEMISLFLEAGLDDD
jgi:hypothetical protein